MHSGPILSRCGGSAASAAAKPFEFAANASTVPPVGACTLDIPHFYAPRAGGTAAISSAPAAAAGTGGGGTAAAAALRSAAVDAFAGHGGAVTAPQLHTLLPTLVECPGYLAYQLLTKVAHDSGVSQVNSDTTIDAAQLATWWEQHSLCGVDAAAAVHEILRPPGASTVPQAALLAFMQHVLQHHPGLEFLQVLGEPPHPFLHSLCVMPRSA